MLNKIDENLKLYLEGGVYLCTIGELRDAIFDKFKEETDQLFKDIEAEILKVNEDEACPFPYTKNFVVGGCKQCGRYEYCESYRKGE